MPNARAFACAAIDEIFSGGYSNIVINRRLEHSDLQPMDRAFASRIIRGVVERKITIDYMIAEIANRPIGKIDTAALTPIRIALYQMFYMDKIPDSAAVNESVKIVKKSNKPFLAGFVNAVLRKAQSRGSSLLPVAADTAESLSICYSCGIDTVKLLAAQLGIEGAKNYLSATLSPSPLTIRVNQLKISDAELINSFKSDGIIAEPTELPHLLSVTGLQNIESDARFLKGFYHIQNTSSAICAAALNAESGERVLDVCAAPGGKTFTVAELIGDDGTVVSCDIYPHKVKLIEQGKCRLGLKSVVPHLADARKFDPTLGTFDRVLCDLPCSGLGVIGRKPEIKYKTADEISGLPILQLEILKNAVKYLKAGGRLVYSTCTVLNSENDSVFQKLLADETLLKFISSKTYYPHIDNMDGFYIAIAEKVE